MRKLVVLAMIVFMAFLLPAAVQAEPTVATPYWQVRGCDHVHRSAKSYQVVKHVLRNHRALTPAAKRLKHWAVCVATREKSRAVWRFIRRSYRWRMLYEHVWPIRLSQVDAGLLSRLASVRYCESTNNYSIDTHHDGAYQYLPSTWSRAQAFYQAVTGRKVIGWTGQANWASPAHQDVVTAVFYPAHIGEWDSRCRH